MTFAIKMNKKHRMLQLMLTHKEPMLKHEVANKMDLTTSNIGGSFASMVIDGLLDQIGGKYQVTALGKKYLNGKDVSYKITQEGATKNKRRLGRKQSRNHHVHVVVIQEKSRNDP
ncbi:hypothetical protein LCGC14_0174650 [marine sediment metagenome]|uniref:ArnR1-like winged helix-turn-helix domain-containing protein n=1 Tax=marine sediment metagenome TaxID=412755 RepID=A0A0F9X9E4_9ZZZZ